MARYLQTTKVKKHSLAKSLTKPLIALFVTLTAMTGALSTAVLVNNEQASADIVNDIVCDGHNMIPFMAWAGPDGDAKIFGKDSVTYNIYRVAHTDDLHFAVESKSTVNAGTEKVDGLLNSFIAAGKVDQFVKNNETILAVDLNSGEPIEDAEVNGGPRLTAFDRFGLAGLTWSRYNGEWRYPYIDICGDSEPRDLKLGVLYTDRLEPLTTYDGVKDTKDVRTAQFGNGLAAHLGEGFLNTTANWTFNVTKGVVALAVALVNFSFTNFTETLGLEEIIGSESGVFSNLYQGVYQPLIIIVMLFLAVSVGYRAIVKREFRGALGMLARSIGLFMISIIVFMQPMFFITLPNNAAIVAQSLIINTMSSGLAGGGGICSTVGAESKTVEANAKAPENVTDAKEAQDLLTIASNSMSSIISCQLWSTFLVKPWSLGQFGADYNKLYAEGKIPTGAYGRTGEIKVDNEWMVGNAAVPMGNGEYIHNWALLQISTNTNVHASLIVDEEEAGGALVNQGLSPYTNGVANDWYRIVDALSNYNEKESEIQDSVTASNNPEPIESIRFAEPDLDKKPSEYWSTWVGGNSFQRIGVAFTSIFAAIAGLLTVIIFGFLSVIYGFGTVILMAFAPLFLLAGSWGNQGWEAFKSWGQLLLNTMVKRVLLGTILVLNLVILTTVLNSMGDQDYFWGVAALALVSYLLWKFKEKIVDTVGGLFTFNFADESIGSKANQLTGRLRGNVRKVSEGLGNVGVATIAGGVAAKRNGAKFSTGAGMGLRKELKNQAYRQDSQFLRQAILTNETLTSSLEVGEICPHCGQTLISRIGAQEGKVIVDDNGNKWHIECAEEVNGGPDSIPGDWSYQDITISSDGKSKPSKPVTKYVKSHVDLIEEKDLVIALKGESPSFVSAGMLLGEALNKDVTNVEAVPAIPAILEPYLGAQSAFIASAMRSGDPRQIEAVLYLYAQALVAYAYDQGFAKPGDYSASPTFPGSRDADVQAVWADVLKELK